jgi:hypothetical protein
MESGNPDREAHAWKLLERSGAISHRGCTFVICIALAPIRVSWARAQDGADESSGARSENDRGYEAGLRAAAAAKSGGQRATVAAGAEPKAVDGGGQPPPNAPAAITAASTTASPGNAPADQGLVPKVKSVWDELTTPSDKDQDTVFHHSNTSPYWLSAQWNFIAQMTPRFHAEYSGPSSFDHTEEHALSKVITLFTGVQLNDSTEGVLDVGSSGWSGLSAATGIAGLVNLDAVRNPELSAEPYLARLWLRKVIALGDETVEIERSPWGLLSRCRRGESILSRKVHIAGFLRHQLGRRRWSHAIHELGGGQQPRLGLCGRYPGVHLRGSVRVRRPRLGSTIRGGPEPTQANGDRVEF